LFCGLKNGLAVLTLGAITEKLGKSV